MELDMFWTKEISRAIEARRVRRVDPTDFERWKHHANLNQAIEPWKVQYSFLFLCFALPTDQNTLFRMSFQVKLKPYTATMNARLRFAHSRFRFSIPSD